MRHDLTELHFPLPAATFTSLWIGNETHFQKVPPFPKRGSGDSSEEQRENLLCCNSSFVLLAAMTLDSVLGT